MTIGVIKYLWVIVPVMHPVALTMKNRIYHIVADY